MFPYNTESNESLCDENNNIISVPSSMKSTSTPYEVYESIGHLVETVIKNHKGELKD